MNTPTQVTIYTYQIGFGDCFLLAFDYPGRTRHVLIDFGTTSAPKKSKIGIPELQRKIADDIVEKCGGSLDMLVVSHRHADHLSGFATGDKGGGSGEIIKQCHPKLIIQPWTEDPELQTDATGPLNPPATAQAFTTMLANMQSLSEVIYREATRMKEEGMNIGVKALKRLEFYGETNVKNVSAIKNLISMGKAEGAKSDYVYYKKKLQTSKLLPGVKITVLGPPTIDQYHAVKNKRSHDAEEFWHLCARAAETQFTGNASAPPEKQASKEKPPVNTRWLISRMQRLRAQELQALVTIMDKAMNNTSVILLFEFNGKKLLFPGDAQIENWEYALKYAKDKEQNLAMLRDVDFYKVGHHGSLNATPKTLWNILAKKSLKADTSGRLKTLLSTRDGKHGKVEENNEVPRGKLVKELKGKSALTDTREIPGGKLCETIVV